MLTPPGDAKLLPNFKQMIRDLKIGGINLRADHVTHLRSPEQISGWLTDLTSGTSPAPLIAADQEGGQSQAFGPGQGFTPLPSAADIGARLATEPTLAWDTGRLLARELKRAGIHWTFAPVSDVDTAGGTIVGKRGRSFGSDPQLVARAVDAVVRGIQSEGILATAKHFPGHGGVVEDTHQQIAVIPKTWSELQSIELVPFMSAIRAQVATVMVGHLRLIDEPLPATLSQKMITERLKQDLGFQGLVITDGLWMQGVLAGSNPEQIGIDALLAGNDVLLYAISMKRFHRIYQSFCAKAASDPVFKLRVDAAVAQVQQTRAWMKISP
jgi:beta-N-acetylhexosaminidase